MNNRFFKKTMRDVPLDGKTVLVRADYNVPLQSDGSIKDDYRVRCSIPTVSALLDRGCTVVLMSHLGRPNGQRNPSMSLEPVAQRLSELLDRPVAFVHDCVGDIVTAAAAQAAPGSVLLLENLRFYPEEEANDPVFAEQVARSSRAAYFVQDGFGVVHRAHASTSAITQFLPSVAGLLLEKEYATITKAVESPERPLVAILGGAKISDKIGVVQRFVEIADKVIVGGAMANTFLRYKGLPVGKSLVEDGQEQTLRAIYEAASKKAGEAVDDFVVLPSDVAVAVSTDGQRQEKGISDVTDDDMILDCGSATAERFARELEHARTVVWNGPVGYTENQQFAAGSARLADALAARPDITSVVGGGDTADFVLHWDAEKAARLTHISTGGGASLELMAGEPMPGVEALMDA